MPQRFIDSIPTKSQIEKLRLALSTYQDGMGQLVFEADKSLPGWRDFERSVALAFDGIAQESKAIFDILVPVSQKPEINYGISCKMRQTLRTVERTGRVTVEVSNSSGKFWDALKAKGINDYSTDPNTAGRIIINQVNSWHNEVSLEQGGTVDISKSFYFLLQWHKKSSRYQLFQYPIHLPPPQDLFWEVRGKRLVGQDNDGIILEWYGHSGGQLKYYPFANTATWFSDVFWLEPLPKNDMEYGLKRRIVEYFPELWQVANEM